MAMASAAIYSSLFLFAFPLFYPIVGAQDLRAPHGLVYGSPAAAAAVESPEAYTFFNPAAGPNNSTTTTAAQIPASSLQSNLARDSVAAKAEGGGGGGGGGDGMVGILIGFLFVVVLVLGVYFVVITRKRNWTIDNNATNMPLA